MADDIVIDVGMDPSQYLAGVDQMAGGNSRLQQSMAGVVTTSSGLQRALGAITPTRATLVGLGGLAAAAANAEQQLSGLSATSAVTGINTGKLGAGIRSIARDMPVGNAVARQTVEQFTKMGVSAAGSEKQITELSKGIVRLSGATGEGPQGLATGMTQFARATGNVNLDTKRFDNLSDSLVRVSKTSGAGATDILAFSKNIAPMATAAGIGATGVLGISGAFARLGEDGIGASTAVNKMLTDMSRSVREGGPQMKTYAEIVGTTADEFERLFKANPGEALNKVVESLAKAGPEGPRQLEMLGLDGVRSQRSLQALSASGGLRPAMEQAQDGYGSGDAKKAADAAFGGLNDSFSELRSSSEQLAAILGAPLTTPLKAFAEALKAPVSLAGSVAGSKVGQTALTGLGIGATALLGAKTLLGPLSLLGLGRQAGKSGPFRGFFAGLSHGAEDVRGSTKRSRIGEPMLQAFDDGSMKENADNKKFMGRTNQRAFQFGEGMGERLKAFKDADAAEVAARRTARQAKVGIDVEAMEWDKGQRRREMNPIRRALDTTKTYGMVGLNTYIGETGRAFENAAENDPRRRSGTLATPDEAREAGRKARTAFEESNGSMKKAAAAFHEHLTNAGRDAGSFGETLKAMKTSTRQAYGLAGTLNADATRVGAGALRRGGRMAMAGAGALGDLMGYGGVAGLGIAAGLGVWQMSKRNAEENKQGLKDYAESDMYSQLNAYREASGRPGVAPQAVGAGTAMEAEDRGKTVSAKEALTVTPEDARLADGSPNKKVMDYYGDDKQIAAQISSMNPIGLDPQDLNTVKLDLLRGGRTLAETQRILSSLPDSTTRVGTVVPTGSNAAGVTESVQGAGQAPTSFWKGVGQGALLQNLGGGPNLLGDSMPDWLDDRPGGGLFVGTMTDEGRLANEQTGKGIQARYAQQSDAYKGEYANQERLKGMDAAIKAADGDKEQIDYLSRLFQKQLMGTDYETKSVSVTDIDRYGGFAKAFAQKDDNFEGRFKRFETAGGSLEEGEGVKAERKKSHHSDILSKTGNHFAAGMFDNTINAPNQNAIAASMANPETSSKTDAAVDAFIAGGRRAGMSLGEVGTQALKASNELNQASQAFKIAKMAFERSDRMQRQENVQGGLSALGETLQRREIVAGRIKAIGNPQTDEMIAMRDGLIDEQTGIDDGLKQRMRARLETQRQYEKAVFRQTRDFNTQMEHAEEDYETSVTRSEEGYGVQRTRSIKAFGVQQANAEKDYATARFRTIRDFNTSIERTEEDFHVGRERQIRDFNISIEHAEADALKARGRAIRDFNIQLKRQIEDAAKSMYDPYTRIQNKATWDARNLMGNMQEQTAAIDRQKSQLEQLRQMGLSAQAIDQLQLGKSENALQVNNLVSDFGTDPKMVAEMNAIAKARAAATGSLFTDESNTDLNRSKEDLRKGLDDMATDLDISLDRARDSLRRSLSDQFADLAKNLKRAREELSKNLKDQAAEFEKNMKRSEVAFNLSLVHSHADLVRNMGYMESDQDKSLKRQRKAFNKSMTDMATDIKDADKVIAGNFADLQKQSLRAMHGQTVDWSKLIVNDANMLLGAVGKAIIPNYIKQLAGIGLTRADLQNATVGSTAGGVGTTANGGASMVGGSTKYADGGNVHRNDGPVNGPSSHSRADDVDAKLTAGEFVQPVTANLHYGRTFMEDVRKLRFPKQLAAAYSSGLNPHREEGPGYAAGGEVWQQMARWINKAVPTAKITSTVRYGDPTSDHDKRRAIDLAGGPGMSRIFDVIKQGFGPSRIRSLYYSPKGAGQVRFNRLSNTPPHIYKNHSDHVHWAMESMAGGAMGAYGGAIGGGVGAQINWAKVFAGFDKSKRGIYAAMANQVRVAIMNKLGGIDGGSSAYSGKGGVAQWGDEVSSVLKMLGRGSGEHGAVMRRIELESSGNARAINNWDSNAKKGTPSKGLMQVIDPTFKSYRSAKLPNNIWDPLANIYAGANYAIKRYGSLSAIDPKVRPVGYDNGGFMKPGAGMHFNGTNKPEPVLTQDQWASISRLAARGGMTINREQSRSIASGCSHTTNHNSYTYDQRNDFGGAEITVVSQDPDDMARKLEKKQVAGRLTQTRGVRRSGR